jgi:hypothetical protein
MCTAVTSWETPRVGSAFGSRQDLTGICRGSDLWENLIRNVGSSDLQIWKVGSSDQIYGIS